ncbi:MAG: hypothetical protein J6W40_01865 [Alphaproteobacteria bacterium]|nr:hypothetical protein [Alphaproteobacteria bacterium]
MAVFKTNIFDEVNRGASALEVILSMAIVAMAAPLVYSQISETNRNIRDMATAHEITELRGTVLNFIRLNQDEWPDVAQIRMTDEELEIISKGAHAGFIDKYGSHGTTITDVYLAFNIDSPMLRVANIAHHIGEDAAIVGADGVAYGRTWAVTAPDFEHGDLIYRISRSTFGEDNTKYLHRGTSGDDELNVMQRDLNMGGNDMLSIGGVSASAVRIQDATATFVKSEDLAAQSIYFSNGANLTGGDVSIDSLRVTGDIMGFRNIYADNLNGANYTTSGRIIADRATVTESVNVGREFVLKSDSARTISGFTGIKSGSVYTSYLTTDEIIFYEDFGLTVSGELMVSTNNKPLKLGNWSFPSTTPPSFSVLTLSRATTPKMPSKTEFGVLLTSDWQSYVPPQAAGGPNVF